MQTPRWPARALAGALVCAAAATSACGGGAREYANDGDTGAAAPATQQTLSPNPAMGDSTQGLQDRTHRGMAAGDSGRPTLTNDSANRRGVGVPASPKRP